MLPLFKVFSLVVRVFARPVIARTKAAHLKKAATGQSNWIKRFYVKLGNFQHKWDVMRLWIIAKNRQQIYGYW
jgi:hypothetical protein